MITKLAKLKNQNKFVIQRGFSPEGSKLNKDSSVATLLLNDVISPSPQPSPQRVEGEITLNPCLRKCAFTLAECATHVDMSVGYRKAAFTLAEGATHVDMSNGYRKAAFTLAEVLITLGIIGVVAAITLPGLMTTIKDKVDSNRMQVIEKRLLQGLNQLNTLDNGLSVPYNSTEDFVKALSKHLKITTICGKDELKNCLPYDEIKYEKDGEIKSAKIEDIQTAGSLKIKEDGFEDTAGFVMADGTPFIVSYNKKCHDLDTSYTLADPDKPMKEISPCLAGVYDINGAKSPNKFGTKVVNGKTLSSADIISLNGGKIGTPCLFELPDGVCVASTLVLSPSISPSVYCDNENNVKSEYQKLGIKRCCLSADCKLYGDTWAGAMKSCADKGMRLPTMNELHKLAQYLYNYNGTSTYIGLNYNSGTSLDYSKIPASLSGLGSSSFLLWSKEEYSDNAYALGRYFYGSYSEISCNFRNNPNISYICVSD